MEGDQERPELVGRGLAPRPTGNEGRAACVPSDELIGRLCGLGSRPDAGVPPYLGDRTFGSIRVAMVEPTAPGGRAGISLGPAPPLGRAHVHTHFR